MADKLGKLLANAINQNIASARRSLVTSGNIDSKHHRLWHEFGYQDELNFLLFFDAYKRQPAANAAIEATIDKTWKDYPIILVGEAPSVGANELFKRLWKRIKGADRRQMIGRFGGVLIQYRDSKPWSEPVDKQVVSRQKDKGIVDLMPFYEGQMQVVRTDDDEMSETYGKVLEWQYTEGALFGDDRPRSFNVHHDRVLIMAEGADDDTYSSGIPLLEAGFNNLTNLQKVSGAAPESFFKNAARQLIYKFGENTDLQDMVDAYNEENDSKDDLKTVLNDIISNLNTGFDSAAFVKDGDIAPLQGDVPDPKPTWEINAMEFAASVRCPMRVIFGSEQGKLAGDQDGESWAERNMARRLWLSGVILELIGKLVFNGVLPDANYNIEWSDLLEPSFADKLAMVDKMLLCNERAAKSGLDIVFTNEECREIANYEPLSEEDKGFPPAEE